MSEQWKVHPLDALVQHFPATRGTRRRRELVVNEHVVCTKKYVVDVQSEAGEDENASRHHALCAPLL